MVIPAHEIAFDFDGVVADTFRLFVEMAKKEYNVDIDYEEITEYDFMRVVKMDYENVAQIFERLSIYPHELDLKPNSGAAEVLARLAKTAPPLSVVTARHIGEPVHRWFEKNIPQIGAGFLKVSATGESTAKLSILKSQGIKYFVEDRVDTCHLLAKEGITPIIYDQPWNREGHSYTVVKSWNDISALIDWESCR